MELQVRHSRSIKIGLRLNRGQRGFDVELAHRKLSLSLVQAGVHAILLEQLAMRANFGDVPMLQDHQAVGLAERAEAVGDGDRRSAANQVVERRLDVALRPGTEPTRCQFAGTNPHAAADVLAPDHEVLARLILASHDDVRVRVVGVPVIDGDPFELRLRLGVLVTGGDSDAAAGRRDEEREGSPEEDDAFHDGPPGFGVGEALSSAGLAVVTEVYGAREAPIPGVSGRMVYDAVLKRGTPAEFARDRGELLEMVAGAVHSGDVVLTLGAGDITTLGPDLLARLRRQS